MKHNTISTKEKQNKNNSKKANAKALGLTVTMNNASVEQATVLSVWKIDQQTRELNVIKRRCMNTAMKTGVTNGNSHPASSRGYTSGGVYIPCIYSHARWKLPQVTQAFVAVFVWYLSSTN